MQSRVAFNLYFRRGWCGGRAQLWEGLEGLVQLAKSLRAIAVEAIVLLRLTALS